MRSSAGPRNHRKDGDSRPAGMSVRFPVSQEILTRVPSLFPNLSAWSWLMRTHGIQKWRGGRKSRAHFSPERTGVESTAPNFFQALRKRVADCKHGFESRRGWALPEP